MNQFLPVTKADLAERGWEEFDFLVITGDAYVDHPSFGPAIISRVLEAEGYRVAILAQPDWRKAGSFTALGRPRLGVLLSSGNIDSMVAHYTVAKKRRHDDAYSPGNRAGLRPDRAVIVYANKVREAFGDIPLVIGGLDTCDSGRVGGVASPLCPLRLLGGQGAPRHPLRQPGGSAGLRHGRARHPGNCGPSGLRNAHPGDYRCKGNHLYCQRSFCVCLSKGGVPFL